MSAAIDLAGRIALVTGAVGGIGSAIVAALEAAGATVVATDIAGAIPLDVTSEREWDQTAERIAAAYGALDILIHNAGLVLVKPLSETTPEEWRRLFAVNVDAAHLGTRAMLPLLRAGAARRPAGASIILMSSVAGLGGGARMVAYCATKGAVRLFAKACAMEFAADRIRVNSVHPGGVDTAMIDEIADAYAAQGLSEHAAGARERLAATHPLGRLASPEEVARAVRFLASDEAAIITGSELVVDGGFTAH